MGDARLIVFAGFLTVFHVSEFVLAALRQDDLSLRSFCFSWPYVAAMAAALAEHALEAAVMPCAAAWSFFLVALSVFGAALSAAGQGLRWAAMVHAGKSFTHSVYLAGAPPRPGATQLVVTGPYAVARHPAYLGFAAWAVGLAVLLNTPAAALLFAFLTLRFFRARIAAEEAGLRALFGEQYEVYAARTRTWLPGVP